MKKIFTFSYSTFLCFRIAPLCVAMTIFILSLPTDSFSQNIGIGTTTPTRAKLEMQGAVGFTSAIFGGEATGISLQRNAPAIGFNHYYDGNSKWIGNGYAAVQYLDAVSGYMQLVMFPNGSANNIMGNYNLALSINNNGNIGIKTSPINASLYAIKAGNFDGSAVFGGTVYNSHFNYGTAEDTYIRGGKNGSKIVINDLSGGKIIMGNGSGFVGINNGIPAYPLEIRQVNGKGLLLAEPGNIVDNIPNNWEFRLAEAFGLYSNLNLLYRGQAKGYFGGGTGDYTTYSDRRLKTNIESMQPVLTKIMHLEPVAYEMKYHNTNHTKTVGFIAQDVKLLFPELVAITTDTSRTYPGIPDLHGINYNGFTVLTIKAIQEQQQLIKKMQQQNKELSRRIEIAEASFTSQK